MVVVAIVAFVGYDTVLWQTSINVEQSASVLLNPENYLLFINKIPNKFEGFRLYTLFIREWVVKFRLCVCSVNS